LIPDNDRDADNSAIFVITASPIRVAIYEKSVLNKDEEQGAMTHPAPHPWMFD
jgi:hypothetical protein